MLRVSKLAGKVGSRGSTRIGRWRRFLSRLRLSDEITPSPTEPPCLRRIKSPFRQSGTEASYVIRSGVFGTQMTLLDFSQSSCLVLFPTLLPKSDPFLNRHCPTSSVLRACPPACHSRDDADLMRTTSPSALPVLPCLPPSMHADAITPAQTGRCACRLLPGPPPTFTVLSAERLVHCPAHNLLGVHSRSGLQGHWDAQGGPLSSQRFNLSHYHRIMFHTTLSVNRSDCYQPKRPWLGGIRTHQENAPLHRHTINLDYTDI